VQQDRIRAIAAACRRADDVGEGRTCTDDPADRGRPSYKNREAAHAACIAAPGMSYKGSMGSGALLASVVVAIWAVTPARALGRAPSPPDAAPPERPAAEAPEAEDANEPELDPAAVEEGGEDEPVDYDDRTSEAPSTVDRVLQNPQVRTMVSLFGHGLMVNDDQTEPPVAPVRVRVRPKGSGASFQFTVLF
jgi:hypothetical protein